MNSWTNRVLAPEGHRAGANTKSHVLILDDDAMNLSTFNGQLCGDMNVTMGYYSSHSSPPEDAVVFHSAESIVNYVWILKTALRQCLQI